VNVGHLVLNAIYVLFLTAKYSLSSSHVSFKLNKNKVHAAKKVSIYNV
jgi:hypothetical protein